MLTDHLIIFLFSLPPPPQLLLFLLTLTKGGKRSAWRVNIFLIDVCLGLIYCTSCSRWRRHYNGRVGSHIWQFLTRGKLKSWEWKWILSNHVSLFVWPVSKWSNWELMVKQTGVKEKNINCNVNGLSQRHLMSTLLDFFR